MTDPLEKRKSVYVQFGCYSLLLENSRSAGGSDSYRVDFTSKLKYLRWSVMSPAGTNLKNDLIYVLPLDTFIPDAADL